MAVLDKPKTTDMGENACKVIEEGCYGIYVLEGEKPKKSVFPDPKFKRSR